MYRKIWIPQMLVLVAVLLTACGTPASVPPTATPVKPTATPLPDTHTAVPPTPTSEPTPTSIPPTKVPSFRGKINVGDYELYIWCQGEGTPTIVLDIGLRGDSTWWSQVFQEFPFDMEVRVCAYDRAGRGSSGNRPREPLTSRAVAVDLHNLLTNANIPHPYIMVGHSMGAYNGRMFTHLYPDDVVGLVLIDGGHPDAFSRTLALIPPPSPDESSMITNFRIWTMAEDPMKVTEYWDILASSEQLRAVDSLGNLPLVVLSRDTVNREAQFALESSIWGSYPIDLFNKIEDEWATLMKELAGLSTNSTYIIVENSSHLIYLYPESVIDAIRIVAEDVRGE